ncbi:MAG: glycosyltransferase family 4 protein [Acidobacteriota bacterium]
MNILLVNRMMGTAWGGGENYDHHLALGLQAIGHKILILTACPPGQEIPREIGGIESVGVTIPYVRRYMYQLAGKIRRLPGVFAQVDMRIFEYASASMLSRLIRQRSIDVVQMLAIPHLAQSLLRKGHPVVMRFPGPPAWFQSGQLRGIGGHPRAAMFTHGDAVRYFRSELGIGVEEVPPGVDGTLFHPDARGEARKQVRHGLGIRDDEFVMVTVGRMIEGKGLSFLIRCMRRLRERNETAKLLVVGGGALEKRLRGEAAGLESSVFFTGQLAKAGVAAHLQASDCFCLMSDYENYSNAAVEAMSTGLPVLASRVGGFPLQVSEGRNGYLVDPGDESGFCRHVARLKSDAGLRESLRAGALAFAQPMEWRKSAARVSEIYERVVAG